MSPFPSAVELTSRLIGFDTINPPGQEAACASYLADLLSQAGFECVLHRGLGADRASLVATLQGKAQAAPALGFTGHIDTVPLGARPWSQDPFAGAIVDGKLYGRGASDMKSGVAAFTAAAIAEADRLRDGPGVVLVITAGEETGCDGAYALARDGALGRVGALVVAEPTSNAPLIGHKGALWLKALTAGVTAHGSMPEQGVNAVYKAARVVSRLAEFDFNVARHPMLGKPTLNVGTLHGGMNVNSVPDRAEIGVDIRTIPGMSHDILRAGLTGFMGEDAEVDVLVDVPGVWTDPAQPWLVRAAALTGRVTGEPVEPRAAPYFTDASVLTPAYGGVPTLILGPGEMAMAHQTDEYCLVERVSQATEIFRALIADWSAHAA